MGDRGDVQQFRDFLLGQGLAERTVGEYGRLARGWTAWLRQHHVDLVAGHHAREWTDSLPESRSSRKAAQAMLRWWQRGELGEDIGLCDGVRVPGRGRPDPDPLSTEEWQRLVATAVLAGGRAGLATLIICFTAARPSEVALMSWDQWDGVRLRWWRPKTRDWHELLAADVLRDQLDSHKASGAMFAGDGGRPHVTSQTIWGWVRRIGSLADVDVHPRRLRSTVATEVLERTGSIDATAAVLGHASVDSTRHYARTSRRRLDRSEERRVGKEC
jgi:integrase